jgi:hypothetical protein
VLIPRILIVIGLVLCSNVLKVGGHSASAKAPLTQMSLNVGR